MYKTEAAATRVAKASGWCRALGEFCIFEINGVYDYAPKGIVVRGNIVAKYWFNTGNTNHLVWRKIQPRD